MPRYIDADALRNKLQNLADDDWNQDTATSWAEAFSECAYMIDDMPTIEPERKKGRWIKITTGAMREKYMCSICGRTIEEDGIERLVRIRYPFCHCGADMTEGEG